ncbi:uncharacterized protein BKCO1_25000143 [Diplodia corticola]|uniref:Uncharacterized protein n=1 Tax=Diplodia corticola TaxID=236234 RepID=A0A1J9S0H6_9PEZI|nr:uncharacterized protein BKCO1_25000143 [Diplodia corticola]OJD34079.1 hypothetical protein BKCO1_25000143 [Diplodia corticola]
MASTSPPSPPGRLGLGKKFEAATRQECAIREQALRNTKQQEISRELHVIQRGVNQRFPEGEEVAATEVGHAGGALPLQAHYQCRGCVACRTHGISTAPKAASTPIIRPSSTAHPANDHTQESSSATTPNDSKSPPLRQGAAPKAATGDRPSTSVETPTTPPSHDTDSIAPRPDDTPSPPSGDPAIAAFRSQLAAQHAICGDLQRSISAKDNEIEALKAEVRSIKATLADADAGAIAEWQAKYENVKRLLHDTQEEVESLEARLKEAKDRERALQARLDEAKDEAQRRERALRNRAEEAEDGMRRLRGECEGLRGRVEGGCGPPQPLVGDYWVPQQRDSQQLQQADGRRDSGVSTEVPLLDSSSLERSAEAKRTSSQYSFTARTDSSGNKRLQTERKRKVNPTRLGKSILG